MANSFDFDLFCDSKAAEAFKCMICLGVPKMAANLSTCGHLGCEECLKTWFVTNNGDKCPVCKASATAKDIQPAAFASMLMRGLEVTCPNNGCGVKMLLGKQGDNLMTHRDTCALEPVACGECKKSIARGMLEEHKRSECRNRLIECKSCGEHVAAYLLDVHTKPTAGSEGALLCAGLAFCPNACSFTHNGSTALPRRLLQEHVQQCPKRTVHCPVCQVSFTLLEFGAHMTAFPSHAASTLDRLQSSEKLACGIRQPHVTDDELKEGLRRLTVFYVAHGSRTPPQRLTWLLPKAATIARVKADVGRLLGTAECKTEWLLVAEVYRHRLFKVYHAKDCIDKIQPIDEIWVYGLVGPSDATIITVQAILTTKETSHNSMPFGTPLVVTITASKIKAMPRDELRSIMNAALQPFIKQGAMPFTYQIHVFDKAIENAQYIADDESAPLLDLTKGTGDKGFAFVLVFESATLVGRYLDKSEIV